MKSRANDKLWPVLDRPPATEQAAAQHYAHHRCGKEWSRILLRIYYFHLRSIVLFKELFYYRVLASSSRGIEVSRAMNTISVPVCGCGAHRTRQYSRSVRIMGGCVGPAQWDFRSGWATFRYSQSNVLVPPPWFSGRGAHSPLSPTLSLSRGVLRGRMDWRTMVVRRCECCAGYRCMGAGGAREEHLLVAARKYYDSVFEQSLLQPVPICPPLSHTTYIIIIILLLLYHHPPHRTVTKRTTRRPSRSPVTTLYQF